MHERHPLAQAADEFLNAAGQTVSSKEAVVEGVEAGRSKSFRLETEGAGIIAFKYAPLNPTQ